MAVRTEQQVAAEVVARLFQRKVMHLTPQTIRAAVEATRVPLTAIKDAHEALELGKPYDRPQRDDTAPPAVASTTAGGTIERIGRRGRRHAATQETAAERANKYGPKGPQRQVTVGAPDPSTGMRLCTRCRETFPADAEHFRLKKSYRSAEARENDDPSFDLDSFCIPCRRKYQRDRYVRVKTIKALEQVGVTIDSPDADLVGVFCVGCDTAIEPGDVVHGASVYIHDRCAVGHIEAHRDELPDDPLDALAELLSRATRPELTEGAP